VGREISQKMGAARSWPKPAAPRALWDPGSGPPLHIFVSSYPAFNRTDLCRFTRHFIHLPRAQGSSTFYQFPSSRAESAAGASLACLVLLPS